jgi:hypothetical protein
MASDLSAADVQQRMAQVRADLHRSTERLKDDVQSLSDWRYHVRQHPWVALGAAGMVAFLAVPRKAKPASLDAEALSRLAQQHRLIVQAPDATKGGSLLGSLAATMSKALLRAGLAYFGQQLGQVVGAAVATRTSPAQSDDTKVHGNGYESP